jgi:hypothetical protein
MAATEQQTALIGIFTDPKQAQQFVTELKRAGFSDDQIGVARPAGERSAAEEGAAAGALTGIIPGAVAGAAATGLIPGVGPLIGGGILLGVLGGAAAGAAAGGLLGALVGWGLSEEEAHHAEREVLAGRTLVAVKGTRLGEAVSILNHLGGSHLGGPAESDKPHLEPLDEQPAG